MMPPPDLFFDTHAHITDPQFDADRGAVLERAARAGVTRVVEIGDAPEDWPRVLALARDRPQTVRCALGLHPYYADRCAPELLPSFLAALEQQSRQPEVVALGELGLDYARGPVAPDIQRGTLRLLLAACRRLEKPVVIHCRDAWPEGKGPGTARHGAYADLRAILKEFYPAPPPSGFWGVVHCFTGSPDDAAFLAAAGFAIGADAPVTYPKNDVLREAFRRVGPAATVLETDSPYLPPQSCRGTRNEPKAVVEIAEALAKVWALPVAEVAQATTANALALYRLPPA
jgi:TatD DNase family protein